MRCREVQVACCLWGLLISASAGADEPRALKGGLGREVTDQESNTLTIPKSIGSLRASFRSAGRNGVPAETTRLEQFFVAGSSDGAPASGQISGGSICIQPSENCFARNSFDARRSDGVEFSVADDFRLAQSGDVTQVCFYGTYFDFDADLLCPAVGINHFTIRYYADAGGLPGNLIATFSQDDGTIIAMGGPVDTGELIAGRAAEYEFVAIHAALNLDAETCYWLEITNALESTCAWGWEFASGGNEWLVQDEGITGYDLEDVLPQDVAFCLDQPLADVGPCRPPPPSNDDCANAEPISGTGEFAFNNLTATRDGSPHASCQQFGEDQIDADVWYCWTAPCTERIVLHDCGLTSLDTRIAVYEGCGTCPPGDALIRACNDDGCSAITGLGSFLAFDAIAGQQYTIRLGVFPQAQRGIGRFSLACGPPENGLCPGSNDCCVAPDVPSSGGCVDGTCCALVCACDPFCCTNFWDVLCAGRGFGDNGCGAETLCTEACGICGTSDVDCCVGVASGSLIPGCSDRECCETVCAQDASCCEREWDLACATVGYDSGDGEGPSGNGAALLCPQLCGTPSCPAGSVALVDPAAGDVDPRQPHPPNDAGTRQGIRQVTLVGPMSENAFVQCWSLCETTDGGALPNQVTGVTTDGSGGYQITLSRPITPGAVTVISYTDDNGVTSTVELAAHPGDFNQDGTATSSDVLSLRAVLEGLIPGTESGTGTDLNDIDHSGSLAPADLLRLIDLLNGANGYIVWQDTFGPSCGVCCP